MENFKIQGTNGTEIMLYLWKPAAEVKGIVQIAHGMAEHLGRYDRFARFLNDNGFVVIGEDHRAHGLTAGEKLGIVPEIGDCFSDTVQDMILVSKLAKERFAGVPLILFGHSYGSFLSQSYIEKASNEISAVVLSGSACQKNMTAAFGRIVSGAGKSLAGEDRPAKLIANLSFGMYDKPFKSEGRQNAWLTRDGEEVEKYNADPLSGFVMSYGFYRSFFKGLKAVYKKEALTSIRKDLPVLILSGDKDPVGGQGKLVHLLYDQYNEVALKDVQIKLYPEARHEILNELNREEVFADVLDFLRRIVEGRNAE